MKIICVGRNYAAHASELNNAVPDEPVLFMKPDTAIPQARTPFYLPDFSNDVHHEVELVLKINKMGKNIQEKFASNYYSEIAVGIDFTARDLQNKLKEKGLPWEKAKAFDGSAPMSSFIPIADFPDKKNINFILLKNKEQVQHGNTADLLFNFDKLVSYISKFFTLKKGDLIFTGTPAGVGKVNAGDRLEAFIEDELMLKVNVR
ncbi:MAG: fumarylacetoacetate hydrolase family protein [Bacteroidia bacterium]